MMDLKKILPKRCLDKFRSEGLFISKFKNTFLQFHVLWPLIISNSDYEKIMSGAWEPTKLKRVVLRVLWFWPRATEAKLWAKGARGGLKDPAHFVEISEFTRETINLIADIIEDRESSILDLGCNAGRHLNLFYERGFRNLHGMEVMGAAIGLFRDKFPDAFKVSTVRHGLWQQLLLETPNLRYEVAFTWGATIETVHPSFPIVRELCRVTKRLVICVIAEHDHYPRFWNYEFGREGFDLIFALRPIDGGTQRQGNGRGPHTSLLIYQRADA